jgi:outer membrane biosynthesis protein TonB
MKIKSILCLATIVSIAFFFACKNDGDAARDAAVQSIQGTTPAGDAASATTPATNPATPTTPEPAQNATGVWHYTCPKGCAGGAGSAVACAKCGTTLAHNAAYHPAPTPTPEAAPSTGAATLPSGITPVENPIKKDEPAQNAKGVWHYTCSAGCAGGAGTATACAKCGKTLAHNQAYHL